jgi:hypothetical protein
MLGKALTVPADVIVRNAHALANTLTLLDLALRADDIAQLTSSAAWQDDTSPLRRQARTLRALAVNSRAPGPALRALIEEARRAERAAARLRRLTRARARRRLSPERTGSAVHDVSGSNGDALSALLVALRKRRREFETAWMLVTLSQSTSHFALKVFRLRARYTWLRLAHRVAALPGPDTTVWLPAGAAEDRPA